MSASSGSVGGGVAQRRQDVRHPAAVVDVHLAAPGDDMQTFAIGSGHRSGSARPCRTVPARGAGEMIGPTGEVKRNGVVERGSRDVASLGWGSVAVFDGVVSITL